MRLVWWFLVPAMLGLAEPAVARPRDDALSGAIRCGVIADSRQWLDCYYGAAQPVRGALGLGSALPAQIALAAAPPAGGPLQDEAVRNEVVGGAAACMRETGDRPWLDCYYSAAMPMRAQLGLSASARSAYAPAPAQLASLTPPPAQAAAPPALPPMPRSTGIFGGLFSDPAPAVHDMPMQSFVLDSKGAFTVTLVDGEIWKQAPEDENFHRARWHRKASQMRVTITPDVMHSFIMTVADEGYMYRVHRIH
jgi:hypothetical protein